ncbi:conserved hypothetical protein [Histoplasma capsulatum var. duboisii H88]|uniref:Outer spore wall protein RRT8 n=1 Tax=Ajellomyces capsulatus (strain H88) TaxID=544711 RepID=F0U702_AJEC8|nr:conserved hypothetical protein [Histoplasma capsulatum var. duboisii H88]QSS51227.1 hypothetical protein I7I53_06493 [Histoplasma capsulatum var. duboisii H88]
MANKLISILVSEVNDLIAFLAELARSGTYIYPFQGILYLVSHRSLRQPLVSKLSKIVSIGIPVTTMMFFFTYIPQMAVLAFTNGPLAPFSAILLVLSESSTITNFLSRSFILRDSLVDTFDGTLIARGDTELVCQGRKVKDPASSLDPISRLGDMIRKPLATFSLSSLVRSLVYLPLNMIPVVGTMMYILSQGKRFGPISHERYFQLKGWDSRQKQAWVAAHSAAYTSFGAAAFALEMVPFASLAFAYTNTVGAALWASNMEKSVYKPPTLEQLKKSE